MNNNVGISFHRVLSSSNQPTDQVTSYNQACAEKKCSHYVYEDHLTLVRMSRVHVPLGSISKLTLLVQKAKLNAIKRLRKVFIPKLIR